ncbi:Uncharacterised protein [uncultured archaeon]|nr:Uncharacterised protein [uncultured archaeon]
MFAKGAWAIFGIKPESLETFQRSLNNVDLMYGLSQAYAVAVLRYDDKQGGMMVGINPFENPRKDEAGQPLGADHQTAVPDTTLFGKGEEEFRINPDLPWYGMWVVFNEAEDVDDIKSKREQASYTDASRPFKFVGKDQKKAIEAAVQPTNVGTRKQFPILLDFQTGRVYIFSTNKDEVATVRHLLEEDLGIEVFGLMWDFDDADWVERFLNKVQSKNKFNKEMTARAEDVRRGLDIEPLEDKVKESVVSNFFACSELDTGQWAALFPNALLKLYEGGEPVTVSNPSDAFNLLSLGGTWDARVYQSGVLFQELDSRINKKGDEKQFRHDLYAFDLNQNWALMDEGAVLVRGFDIPNFKKDILKGIRKSKQEQPVSFYWSEWLRQMNLGIFTLVDNVNLTLDVKGGLVNLDIDPKETEIEAS